jgi:arylsulfatase A-like enzyme
VGIPARPLAALLVLGAAGCAPRACSPPEVREDLLEGRLAIAEKRWDGVLLEIGAPQALPFLGEGWSYGEPAPDGSLFRWAVAERSSFRFESDREGTYVGYFECEPFVYAGSPAQWIEVAANGSSLAPFELRPGRERYPVELPVVRGENQIDLRFRYAGAPTRSEKEKRRLAAAFFRFEVPFSDFRARAGAFAAVGDGMFLPAEGSLSFFLELPADARLRIRAGASDPPEHRAPAGAEVVATLVAEDGDLWTETFTVSRTGGESWERELPSSTRGSPVELKLQAGSHDLLLRPELLVPRVEQTTESRPEPASRRSIVVLVLDGASAERMGLYGGDAETTPNLDALGRESVVFDIVVTQAVYTIASIGSLLTGQYPERHQSVSFADRLRDDVITLPSLLSQAGYRTAAFPGNAVVSKPFGLDRGYQEFFPVWEREDYTGHGDSVVRAFKEWFSADPRTPFFAYVHFREPHFPYNPPPPFDTRFGSGSLYPGGIGDTSVVDDLNRKAAEGEPPSEETIARVRGLYLGNLAYVDALVGEILGALDEETIVVVTADHGEALFEHGFLGHNTQLYEESTRIPLVIRAPDFAPRRVPDVVELIDLTPTLAELAGVARSAEVSRFQGRSLVPALDGRSLPKKLAFSRTLWAKPRYSVRSDRFKLIWDTRTGGTELYDLERDPGEREPIANRVRGGYLKEELLLWYREQERLKAEEPAPDDAVLSDEERRRLESLNYVDHLPEKKPQ